MSSKQGLRAAGMRTAAKVAYRRLGGCKARTVSEEAAA